MPIQILSQLPHCLWTSLLFLPSLQHFENYYDHDFAAVIGEYVVAVNYEPFISEYSVPAIIAYGEGQCGKLKATKSALSKVGLMKLQLTF